MTAVAFAVQSVAVGVLFAAGSTTAGADTAAKTIGPVAAGIALTITGSWMPVLVSLLVVTAVASGSVARAGRRLERRAEPAEQIAPEAGLAGMAVPRTGGGDRDAEGGDCCNDRGDCCRRSVGS